MAEDIQANETPDVAKDAVFKVSQSVPDDSKEVRGVEFNDHTERNITVAELLSGMSNMGFQATSVGEAVRLINEMVCQRYCWFLRWCLDSMCACSALTPLYIAIARVLPTEVDVGIRESHYQLDSTTTRNG
jgi:hypothetical protein